MSGSAVRCPRCQSRRIEGDETCPKCGWRFQPPRLADYGVAREAPPESTTIVQIRPDPFERRQVARWILAAFEVTILVSVAFVVGASLAGILAALVANALGNDLLGVVVPVAVWSALGGLILAYVTLRRLAA